MKKTSFLFIGFLMTISFAFAQEHKSKTSLSPRVAIFQDFGLFKVSLNYSRPSVRDRDIFSDNGLVPYGKLWRTGASGATKIEFSENIKIGGKVLNKGAYALLTTPNKKAWDIHFYAYNSGKWKDYKTIKPNLTVTVIPQKRKDFTESLLITIANLRSDSATLQIIWDKLLVPIKLETIKN